MIAQTVEVTRDLWQSWAVTVGGLVGAVVTLSLLAKVPGGRHAFKFLVADPVGRWMDNQMERKIETAVGLQTDAVKVAVRHHVRETLGSIEENVDCAREVALETEDDVAWVDELRDHGAPWTGGCSPREAEGARG